MDKLFFPDKPEPPEKVSIREIRDMIDNATRAAIILEKAAETAEKAYEFDGRYRHHRQLYTFAREVRDLARLVKIKSKLV